MVYSKMKENWSIQPASANLWKMIEVRHKLFVVSKTKLYDL